MLKLLKNRKLLANGHGFRRNWAGVAVKGDAEKERENTDDVLKRCCASFKKQLSKLLFSNEKTDLVVKALGFCSG